MIEIKDKYKCCGCAACVQVCPMNCINFVADECGFSYPFVDKELCVNCGLCEKVCQYLNQNASNKPHKVYASKNLNEKICMESSSGGIFTMIAEMVIARNGVVFGARFDENWEVVHDYTETNEGIGAFRGSKYVQSRIGIVYKQVKEFLATNRLVLFTGTPCQIAGLHKYLQKDCDNLITMDVVCHGVPSPLIWREYLLSNFDFKMIKGIKMKDKNYGWRGYHITIDLVEGLFTQKATRNEYMQAFVRNSILRKSCFSCPAKSGRSYSDITLGDFWGVEKYLPQIDDDKGVSLILTYTLKGKSIIESLNVNLYEVDYDSVIKYNSCIYSSTTENLKDNFWFLYFKNGIGALKEIFIRTNVLKIMIAKMLKKI